MSEKSYDVQPEPNEQEFYPTNLSAPFLQEFINHFKPSTDVIYYPGSSNDVSVAHFFSNARVIHVDTDPNGLLPLEQKGFETHVASVDAFRPDAPLDIVVLSNAAFNEQRAVLQLKVGGYVLANNYQWNARNIASNPDFECVGIVTGNSNEKMNADIHLFFENAPAISAAFLSDDKSNTQFKSEISGDSLFIFTRIQNTNPTEEEMAVEDRQAQEELEEGTVQMEKEGEILRANIVNKLGKDPNSLSIDDLLSFDD
ncbi:MAG: hypothetical protein ABI758_00560 [Candidatus Woesebacteria bacterium]